MAYEYRWWKEMNGGVDRDGRVCDRSCQPGGAKTANGEAGARSSRGTGQVRGPACDGVAGPQDRLNRAIA